MTMKTTMKVELCVSGNRQRLILATFSFFTIACVLSLLLSNKRNGDGYVYNINNVLRVKEIDDADKVYDSTKMNKEQTTNSPSIINWAESVKDMKNALQLSKVQFTNQLSLNYGSVYWKKIFLASDNSPRSLITNARNDDDDSRNDISYNRFKRKVTIKLLQAIIERSSGSSESELIPFVWATSGNSVAAAHGNLFNESYTSVLEQAMQSPLRELGLEFTTRSYGMSATTSAPESAFCQQEIYGKDIDILTWHYALTDGSETSKLALSLYRAGYNPNKPVMLTMQIGGFNEKERIETIHAMQDMGLSVLIMDENSTSSAFDAIPDSFGLTNEQIDELPPFVRNFRCDRQLENGDPYCKEQKFNLNICPHRIYQTSWHPGWKWNAVIGYLASFTMFKVFEDSMEELLLKDNTSDASVLLENLLQQEDNDYQQFYEADAPRMYLQPLINNEDIDKVDIALLAKTPSFCHTALLPSQTRFKGILTETKSFDGGIGLLQAGASDNNDEYIRLVYSESERFRDHPENDQQSCPAAILTSIDFQNYFYLENKENWKKLIIPNDSEIKEYGSRDHQQLKGFVAVCFTEICPYQNCPPEALHRDALKNGELLMNVNGMEVMGTTQLRECDLLKHQDGLIWRLNDDGRIELEAKVTVPTKYLRVSSIIVW